MELSIVIPTYNRSQLLQQGLPALVDQQADGVRYEIVYVINGSTDDSESVLQQASARWPEKVRYFRITGSGTPAAPRNRGIREARGTAVLVLDDDVIADPDLVRRHVEFHRAHPEPHHAALGELYVPAGTADDPAAVFHEMFGYEGFRGLDRLEFLDFWTCNVSFKRDFMLAYGMFDETLAYFEDVECGYRLSEHGMYLHFLPEARGQHLQQFDLDKMPAKARVIGRSLYEFEHRVPENEAREIRARHGILSRDLPPRVLLRRLLNRAGFALLANPPVLGVLRRLAARTPTRTRTSDLYHYVRFRHHMRAAYREASREARQRARTRRVPDA